MSADAAEYLEALEDAADAIAARRALAEQAPSVPAKQVWPSSASTTTGDRRPVRPRVPAGGSAAAAEASQDAQRRPRAAVEPLGHQPRPPGAVKLAGTDDLWQVRVGDFRVIYTIADQTLVVTVVRVANRREVYRGI